MYSSLDFSMIALVVCTTDFVVCVGSTEILQVQNMDLPNTLTYTYMHCHTCHTVNLHTSCRYRYGLRSMCTGRDQTYIYVQYIVQAPVIV